MPSPQRELAVRRELLGSSAFSHIVLDGSAGAIGSIRAVSRHSGASRLAMPMRDARRISRAVHLTGNGLPAKGADGHSMRSVAVGSARWPRT